MTRATVPLARHREVRDKLSAAQTRIQALEAERDELRRRLKGLGEQLDPMVKQMSQLVGENRVLKLMIVRIKQQLDEQQPKLEVHQSIPQEASHG